MSTSANHKASLGASSSLPASLQNLQQKQSEYAGLQALKEASDQLVQRAERLAAMSTTMADGGESIGMVLQNWSYVFAVLEELGKERHGAGASGPNEMDDEPLPLLVRLPYSGEGEGEGEEPQ